MNVPLNFISEKLSLIAVGKTFYVISLAIFIAEMIFGFLYLLWLSTFPKLKRRGVRWVYYVYQFCFFIDLGVCIAESVLSAKYFSNVAVAYFTCLFKFILLLLLYGLVCAHKAILNLREQDALKQKESVAVKEFVLADANGQNQTERSELLTDQEFDEAVGIFTEDDSLVNVNVAYVKEVIRILKQKGVTDEEYNRLCLLDFELNSLPKNEENAIRKLNVEFEFLIKKMSEYNVCV